MANRLEQIEAAWSKATEGPYYVKPADEYLVSDDALFFTSNSDGTEWGVMVPTERGTAEGEDDCRFLALSWEAVRELVAVAKAALRLQRDGYACTPARVEMDEALSALLKEA